MDPASDAALTAAKKAFLEFLAKKESEEQVDFEQFCLAHAESTTLAAGAGVSVVAETALPAFVPSLTTTAGLIVALMQAGRLQTIVPLYQETATHLKLLAASFRDKGDPSDAARAEFVEACESVTARENDSWRAEWINDEAARKLVAELETPGRQHSGAAHGA